jgi:hypothetical protein
LQKRNINLLGFLVLAGTLATAAPLNAQQLVAVNSDPSTLPSAPVPQLPSFESSSIEQTQTPSPAQTNPQPNPQTDTRSASQKALDAEEHQRMLGVIPNFSEVIGGEAPPLSPKQKYQLFFKSSVDPFQFVAAALDSGLEEAEDSFQGYGWGPSGYAKRYGASFADGFIGNFFGNAVLPAAFHQDPRYFRKGTGSAKSRVWYVVKSTVVCRGDNGHQEFNYSNIAGNFIGGGISNLYYPANERGVGLTLENGLTVTAEGSIGSLAEEFYPDFIAYLHRRHQHALNRKAAAAQPAALPNKTTP